MRNKNGFSFLQLAFMPAKTVPFTSFSRERFTHHQQATCSFIPNSILLALFPNRPHAVGRSLENLVLGRPITHAESIVCSIEAYN